MPFGKLDFDLSDDEKQRVRRVNDSSYVTADDRSVDFTAITRTNHDGTPETYRKKKSSSSTPGRLCCVLFIGAVIIGVIVGSIYFAVHSSNNNDEPVPPPPMNTTTTAATPPPPVTPPPPIVSVPDGNSDDGEAVVAINFLCNHLFTAGARAGRCMAVFSVDNPSGDVVTVEVGPNNFVEPGPDDVGQLTSFAAGMRYGGASFEWDCTTHLQARWTLRTGSGTSTATAPRIHQECPKIPGT